MICRIVIPRVLHIMGCIVAVYYGLPSVVCHQWYAISGMPAVLSMHVSVISGILHCATAGVIMSINL